jgi:L-asparaginase II
MHFYAIKILFMQKYVFVVGFDTSQTSPRSAWKRVESLPIVGVIEELAYDFGNGKSRL